MSKSKRFIHFIISILAFVILLYIDMKFDDYASRSFKLDYYVITMGILYFLLGYFVIGREKLNDVNIKNMILFALFYILTMIFFTRGFVYLPRVFMAVDNNLLFKGFYLISGILFSRN